MFGMIIVFIKIQSADVRATIAKPKSEPCVATAIAQTTQPKSHGPTKVGGRATSQVFSMPPSCPYESLARVLASKPPPRIGEPITLRF